MYGLVWAVRRISSFYRILTQENRWASRLNKMEIASRLLNESALVLYTFSIVFYLSLYLSFWIRSRCGHFCFSSLFSHLVPICWIFSMALVDSSLLVRLFFFLLLLERASKKYPQSSWKDYLLLHLSRLAFCTLLFCTCLL